MRGFLSKFLRNNKGDQKPSAQSRLEPTITAGQRSNLHEPQEDLHPDATFIEYELSNDDSPLSEPPRDDDTQTSDGQARACLESATSERDYFDETFQDDTDPDVYQPHDSFEPSQGFNSSWMNSAQDNKTVKSISINTTLDAAGNAFIHYAAAFGKSHLLKQMIEDGWSLDKQNYFGKTPYDFAVHYDNSTNAYFIENIQKGLRHNFDTQEKASSADGDATQDSVPIAPNSTQSRIESLPNTIWRILVETNKSPRECWGHRYDPNATDEGGNTLLHYAAKADNKSYTLHLLGLGWGILAKNNDGLTPLEVAEIEKNTDLVDTLKRLYKLYLNEHAESDETLDAPSRTQTSTETEPVIIPKGIGNQSRQSGEIPTDDIPDVFSESLEPQQNDKIIEFHSQEDETLSGQSTPACIKCGAPFAEFKTAIKLWFCPFCGAEQTDGELQIESTESPPEDTSEEAAFTENASGDHQFNSSASIVVEEEVHASTLKDHIAEEDSQNNKHTHHSKSASIGFVEELFHGVDEGFDAEIIDIDLQRYEPGSRGRNSSDENHEPLSVWRVSRSENVQTQEWEIFLDEDLEEQSHPSDQFFEDEDPLEQGKIVEYASRLTSRITSYQSKDRRRLYAFIISILGDFPFYQSYAAMERLIAKDVQIDQIRDAYAVKLLWMTNPNIWSSRRYNRMENSWSVSRNPKLKNSMSWQLASDLVNFLTPDELENLVVNDWYAEWLNLPLHGGDTASGLDPAYSLYPTYLYEKRRLLTLNMNTW